MEFSQHRLNPNSQLPIGNKNLKPIANSQLIDTLLETYESLIDPDYKKWFAKAFYYMTPEAVAQCASEARADGKDARRLFSYLVKKRSSHYAVYK